MQTNPTCMIVLYAKIKLCGWIKAISVNVKRVGSLAQTQTNFFVNVVTRTSSTPDRVQLKNRNAAIVFEFINSLN
jgi:hypothetical protein